MPFARRARRVPGLAPRGGSRIRTGGDALAALVLGALAVSICSSIIAALHELARRELRGARPRLPARGDRRGVPVRPARGRPDGDRGDVPCSTSCCCRPAASRRPTRASGCCSPRCSCRAPPSRSWPRASGGAREQAYEREREAALLAGLSSALVGGASLELAQVDAARVAAAAIGAPAARIVLGRGPLEGQVALPLDVDGRVIGRLELMGARPGGAGRRDRAARRALAGRRAGARTGARAARPRRCRGRGAARVRRAQDGAAAGRLARAAHAADGDQGRRGSPARRPGAARRGGRARAARGRQHRDRPARPARLRPARRLAPAGRHGIDGARLVRGRRSRARRGRGRALACAGRARSRSRPRRSSRSCAATPRRSSACSST